MTSDTQFLTPNEVAEILGVHQKTVHQWLRTGKLSGTKISYRAWRIPRSALEDLVKQNSNKHSRQAKQAKNDHQPETTQSQLSDTTSQPQAAATPASKMKLYIRDIMGEDNRDSI